jgi:hypothetical protein
MAGRGAAQIIDGHKKHIPTNATWSGASLTRSSTGFGVLALGRHHRGIAFEDDLFCRPEKWPEIITLGPLPTTG